jgi:hypothetical protein
MGFKTLRFNEIDMATWGTRRFRSKTNVLKKFRSFIEKSKWDEKLLKHEKWMDICCLAVIAVSVLFFVPVVLSVFRGC